MAASADKGVLRSQQLPLVMKEASQQLLLQRLCLLLASVAVRSKGPAFQQLAQYAIGLFDKGSGASDEVRLVGLQLAMRMPLTLGW